MHTGSRFHGPEFFLVCLIFKRRKFSLNFGLMLLIMLLLVGYLIDELLELYQEGGLVELIQLVSCSTIVS